MSPIPTVATATTLFTPAPSTIIDPGSPGQSASTSSQYLVGTGGFLFAVVAILSLAGYLYHRRNAAQKSVTWSPFTGFLSSIRQLGSSKTSTAAATHCAVQLENCAEHVNMVYARFFHPTFWNLVECHPATPSAPAIYVEEEAKDVPKQDPKPYGMTSFLDMDENDSSTPSREMPNKVTKARVKQVPPYDTSSPTNVNFVSQVIGTTIRPDGFLYVPGQGEDDLSEDSDLDSDFDPEFDFASFAYDGIATAPLTVRPNGRRHGMADMQCLAESLKDALLEEGPGLVSTVTFCTGLADVSELLESDPVLSCASLGRRGTMDDSVTSGCDFDPSVVGPVLAKQVTDNRPANSKRDSGSSDDPSLITSLGDVETLGTHSSVDSLWKLYDECFEAMDDTLTTSESDMAVYEGYDDTEVMSCKPLRRLGKVDDGSMAPEFDAGIYDGSNSVPSPGAAHPKGLYAMQSPPSKQSVDTELRSSDNDISSYGSHDSFQGSASDIDTLEGPEELEDLITEIYGEYLQYVDDNMTLECDIDVCGSCEGVQIDSRDAEPVACCTPLHSLGTVDDGTMASDYDVNVHDSRFHTQSGSSYVTTSSPADYHNGPSVTHSFPSKQLLGDSDHDDGCYDGCDKYQDNLSDTDSLEGPDDVEDLLSKIYAEFLYWSESAEADATASNSDVVRDDCPAMQISPSNADAIGASSEDPDFMRRILTDLRDPELGFSLQDISEDSDSEYCDDHEEGGVVSRNSRRNSLQSSHSSNGTPDSDVSDEGSIYPLTPPPMSATSVSNAPNILDGCMSSPNTPGFHQEAQVVQSLPKFSPLALRSEAYFLDPFLDCRPQDFSGEHSDDTEEESNIPRRRLPRGPHNERRGLFDFASSDTGTGSDVSNKGPTYPLTPLSMPIPVASAPDVRKGRMSLEIPLDLAQEVQVISCHSPPALPRRTHIPRASHRNSRSAMYGPRLPLQDLPRI